MCQTRNRGTIGGSLANADPAAEIGLAALALDAEIVRARSGRGRARDPPIGGASSTGPMETALAPDECLIEIGFPACGGTPAGIGIGFQEVSVRHSDFALVRGGGAARARCWRHLPAHRHRVGGAGATPLRIAGAEERLVGTRLEERDIAAAARSASTMRSSRSPITMPRRSIAAASPPRWSRARSPRRRGEAQAA